MDRGMCRGWFIWLLAGLGFWLLAGCGGRSVAVSGAQPPQTERLIEGTGRVADAADATARVLAQYLQVTVLNRGVGDITVGLGADDPMVAVYLLPGGPFPAGTSVGGDLDSPAVYALPEPTWLFWVDPNPAVPLARRCHLLYLRASDGRILVQAIDSDPLVGGQRVFPFQKDLDSAVIYRHGLWDAYRTTEPAEPASAPGRAFSRSPDGVVKGLLVSGLYGSATQRELDALHDALTEDLGLEPEALRKYYHTFESPITKEGFFEAIRAQCEGLGEGDKFLLVLSTDAGRVINGFSGTASGVFRIGRDGYVTFAELCRKLAECEAENINLVLDTNYSGLAIDAFGDWTERSNSRIQILTSTSADKPNLGSWYLRCLRAALRAKLEAAKADRVLTIEEIEAAFAANGVTRDEIREKFLDDMDRRVIDEYGPDLSDELKRRWRATYRSDLEYDGGATDSYRPNGEPQAGGFDGRPRGDANEGTSTATPFNSDGGATGVVSGVDRKDCFGPISWTEGSHVCLTGSVAGPNARGSAKVTLIYLPAEGEPMTLAEAMGYTGALSAFGSFRVRGTWGQQQFFLGHLPPRFNGRIYACVEWDPGYDRTVVEFSLRPRSVSDSGTADVEPNNTPEQAGLLTASPGIRAGSCGELMSDPVDWYRFHLAATSRETSVRILVPQRIQWDFGPLTQQEAPIRVEVWRAGETNGPPLLTESGKEVVIDWARHQLQPGDYQLRVRCDGPSLERYYEIDPVDANSRPQ